MGDGQLLTMLGLNALRPTRALSRVERHHALNGLAPALELQAPIERGTDMRAVIRGGQRVSAALAVDPASL